MRWNFLALAKAQRRKVVAQRGAAATVRQPTGDPLNREDSKRLRRSKTPLRLRAFARVNPVLAGLLVAAPLAAQQASLPPSTAEPASGLVGSVSDESEWQDLGIAIPGFATDRDVATPAGQSAALGRQLGEVITADLRNNGLFKPTGPGALPGIAYSDVTDRKSVV